MTMQALMSGYIRSTVSLVLVSAIALPLAAAAAALAIPAFADVKDGVDAWQAGDYQKAVAEWRPLAVAGFHRLAPRAGVQFHHRDRKSVV